MRTAGIALSAVMLVALAACGGSDDDSSIEPLEPEPTSSVITDTTAADPGERPEDEQTEDGAIAFSEFAVRSIVATGAGADPDDFLAMSVAGCEGCVNLAKEVAQTPDQVQRYQGPLTFSGAEVVDGNETQSVVVQTVDFPAGQEVNVKDDSVVEEIEPGQFELRLLLQWTDDQWFVGEYSVKEL